MSIVFPPTLRKISYPAEVLDAQTVDARKWNDLVEAAEAGVPFACYEFNVAAGDETYYIVVPDDRGEYLAGGACRVRGVLPVAGSFFASLWMDGSAMARRETDARRLKAAVYEKILGLAREKNLVQVYLTHWSREEDETLLRELNFTVEENATFEIGLEPAEDGIFQNFRSSNKRLIKQAEKHRTRTNFLRGAEAAPALAALQSLRQETQKRAIRKNRNASMLLKADAFLYHLLEQMQERAIIGQAFNDGKESASILLLATSRKAYYYIGGSDYEAVRKNRASNLLHWDCIKYLKGEGIECYDLGGVPFDPPESHPAYGVYRFKKSFGGKLKVYYSGHCIINQRKYFLYNRILSHPGIRRTLNKALHVWHSGNH